MVKNFFIVFVLSRHKKASAYKIYADADDKTDLFKLFEFLGFGNDY